MAVALYKTDTFFPELERESANNQNTINQKMDVKYEVVEHSMKTEPCEQNTDFEHISTLNINPSNSMGPAPSSAWVIDGANGSAPTFSPPTVLETGFAPHDQGFLNWKSAPNHSKTLKSDKNKVKCDICLRLLYAPLFKNHHRRHFQSLNYPEKCPRCPFPQFFKSSVTLNKHISAVHKNSRMFEICEICGKTVFRYQSMQKHMRSHEKRGRTFKCIICKTFYIDSYALFLHNQQDHSDKVIRLSRRQKKLSQQVSCLFCGQVIYTCALKQHQRQHRQITAFKCDQCSWPQYFTSEMLLHHHKTKCHKPTDSNFECTVCARVFHYEQSLIAHSKVHEPSPELPVRCSHCDFDHFFKTDATLQHHLLVYHGLKPLKQRCPICNVPVNSVKRHILVHTKSERRNQQCPICPQSWYTSNSIMSHMKLTHGRHAHKNYKLSKRCTICGVGTASARHNMRHEKSASRCVACPICPQTWFLDAFQLMTHGQKWHAQEFQNCNICGQELLSSSHLKTLQKTLKRCHPCPICAETWFSAEQDVEQHLREFHPGASCAETPVVSQSMSTIVAPPPSVGSKTPPTSAPCKSVDTSQPAAVDTLHTNDQTMQMTEPETAIKKPKCTKMRFSYGRYKSCPICGLHVRQLSAHMKSHNKPGRALECTICNIQFRSVVEVKKHNDMTHKNQALLKMSKKEKPLLESVSCVECRMVMPKFLVRRHQAARHEIVTDFECDQCEWGHTYFPTAATLRAHKHKKHNRNPKQVVETPTVKATFQCPNCPKVFKQPGRLNIHLQTHEPCEKRRRSARDLGQRRPENETEVGMDMLTHVASYSFENVFLPDQIIVKLDRTDFGRELEENMGELVAVTVKMEQSEKMESKEIEKQEVPFNCEPKNTMLQSISNVDNLSPAEPSSQSITAQLSDSVRLRTEPNPEATFSQPSFRSSFPSSSGTVLSRMLATCSICQLRPPCMAEHILSHIQTADRPHPCPICPRTWFSATELKKHLTTVHQIVSNQQPSLPLVSMFNTFNAENPNSEQLLAAMQEGEHQSALIGHRVNSAVATGVDRVNMIGTNPPPQTPPVSGSLGANDTRVPTAPPVTVRCPYCNVATPNLIDHLLTHSFTGMKFSACPFCSNPPTFFANVFDLRAHLTQTHASEQAVARSSLVAGSSSTVSKVQNQTPVGLEQRPVTNLPAQATTAGSFESTIEEVVERVTNQPKMAPIGLQAAHCEICLQQPMNMSEHMCTHRQTEQRPLPCPIRPQTWFEKDTELNCILQNSQACAHADPLSTAHDLILNTRSQSTFECKQNDEEEIMDCAAVEDLLMSDGQAKHPIEATSFNRLRPIKTILRRKCLVCGMRPRRMNVHMQRHTKTEQRSMPCPFCPQTWFSVATFLERHMTTIHPRHNTGLSNQNTSRSQSDQRLIGLNEEMDSSLI